MKVYRSDDESIREGRVKVGIAELAARPDGATLVTSGLGSCVGIALFEPRGGVLGLAHSMLPVAAEGPERDCTGPDDPEAIPATTDGGRCEESAKYVDTAVPALVDRMRDNGARADRIRAKLAGGSTMFEFNSADQSIGARNVAAARQTLDRLGIDLVAEDVGGEHGRSLELRGADGELAIRSANQGRRVI
jgi:chemotaxis protein CheD